MSALPFTVGRYGRHTHTPEGIAATVKVAQAAQSNFGPAAKDGPNLDHRNEGAGPGHASLSPPDLASAKREPDFVNDGMPLAAKSGLNSPKAGTGLSGPAAPEMMTQGELARVQGFTGDCCTGCGGFTMRRNGTCLLCTACGSTTGCS